jgi:NADPH:quinone reductase-like Zn-dependent oxidoreductase
MMKTKLVLFAAMLGVVSVLAQSGKPKMKAIVVHEYGGPEVLKYEDAPRPEPKADEILIRVLAGSVNPVDVAIRKGYLARIIGEGRLPLILGMDAAGIVEKTGGKIDKFKKGDAVFAFFTLKSEGGYGEYAVAKVNEVALKPKEITFGQAAAVGAAGATAWEALVEKANLVAGQTVLIHGGSGGVGHLAIQIAKARGAKVIATASTPNQDFLKSLGADVAIDYTKQKFEDIAKDVDVVLDSVGGDTLTRSYGVVKKGGIIVSIVDDPDGKELTAHEIRGTSLRATPKAEVMDELARLLEAKKLMPMVSQALPLTDVVKAQEQIASRHTVGKIVLIVAEAK